MLSSFDSLFRLSKALFDAEHKRKSLNSLPESKQISRYALSAGSELRCPSFMYDGKLASDQYLTALFFSHPEVGVLGRQKPSQEVRDPGCSSIISE